MKEEEEKGNERGIAIMTVDFYTLTMYSPLHLLIWENQPEIIQITYYTKF